MRRLIATLFVIATLTPTAHADPCGGCWGITTGAVSTAPIKIP